MLIFISGVVIGRIDCQEEPPPSCPHDDASDPRKAQTNAAKHGVTFDEAVTIFLDASALDGPDLQHSTSEPRFRRLGASVNGRVLMVVYTVRSTSDVEAIRIISAPRASREERAAYHAAPSD